MRYETCSQCDKEKHETEFYSNGSGKLRSSCKDCTKASRRSEAYKAAQLTYDRSEKGRERKRRYSKSDLGKVRNQDHYYRWRDERKDGVRSAKIKRRFTAEEWQAIQEKQKARLANPFRLDIKAIRERAKKMRNVTLDGGYCSRQS